MAGVPPPRGPPPTSVGYSVPGHFAAPRPQLQQSYGQPRAFGPRPPFPQASAAGAQFVPAGTGHGGVPVAPMPSGADVEPLVPPGFGGQRFFPPQQAQQGSQVSQVQHVQGLFAPGTSASHTKRKMSGSRPPVPQS